MIIKSPYMVGCTHVYYTHFILLSFFDHAHFCFITITDYAQLYLFDKNWGDRTKTKKQRRSSSASPVDGIFGFRHYPCLPTVYYSICIYNMIMLSSIYIIFFIVLCSSLFITCNKPHDIN